MNSKLTNTLLGVLSSLIITAMAFFGNTIISVDKRLSVLESVYAVQIPDMKNDIGRLKQSSYILPTLVGKKEDE